MMIRLDIHLHTRRHSACSSIDERQLVSRAIAARLNGVVITEHHYQWGPEELAELREESLAPPNFLLLSGFEYTSEKGDILVYGLDHLKAVALEPGRAPEYALAYFQDAGAVCVAAHPTREMIPFDDRIFNMPFNGIETRSVNLREHEQRLAIKLASGLGIPPTASSDAHRLGDVGAYATDFEGPIEGMADFVACMRRGAFCPAASPS